MKLYKIGFAAIVLSAITLAVFTDQKINIITSNALTASISEGKPDELTSIVTSHNHKTIITAKKINMTTSTTTTESPIERLKNLSNKTDLQQNLVDEHDNFKRYPVENRAFNNKDQDPITQRYSVDERTTLNEDKSIGLTLWSDKKYYLENDTVTVNAYLQDAEGLRQATTFNSSFYYDQNQSLGEIEFSDENNDGVYQATIQLTQANTLSKGPGIYKIWIQDVKNDITDAITFTLSQPDIELTGNYKEFINSNGNLIIEAQVKINASSQFYIQASLYSSGSIPIGVTQLSQPLTKGNHWVPLSFSGLMIQDSEESGPYVLKQVSVAKVTMPMQRGPLVEPNFITESYGLSEFSQK
jgi:RNase H-fold protein (predicted Holliday junction resolvase)